MTNRAPITVDGKLVGYLSLSWSEEIATGDGLPPSVGLVAMTPSPGAVGEYGHPSHHGIGDGHVPEKHGPTFRKNIGPGHRQREHEAQQEAHHDKNGPTFRSHLTPRGSADPAKPEHFTVGDVQAALHPGDIDRGRFARELERNPALRDKILRIAHNEQGVNRQGTQAVLESMMNRAEVRGTDLETQARWYGTEHGGYYARGGMGRGALENQQSREVLERSLRNTLGGSNISNYATDNSSGGLAARETATGAFRLRSRYTGESFFAPGTAEKGLAGAYDRWLGNVKRTNPASVTRLGPGSVPATSEVHPEGARKVHPESLELNMRGMPAQKALAQARSMAAKQGFDPNKIIIGEKQYIFKIGKGPGVEDTSAAATFSPDSGIIRLYPTTFDTKQLPGILTHEMFHAKVNNYVKKHGWPSTEEILRATAQPEGPIFRGTGEEGKRPRSIGPGAGRGGNLVSDYGEEYLKALPRGPVFRGSGGHYSSGSSIGPGIGKTEAARDALNENLAEMARIKYESGGHAPSFSKNLEAIYDKIEKSWKPRK